MTEEAFHLLARFGDGERLSRSDKEKESYRLTTTDANNLLRSWEYLENDKLIQSTDPVNTNYNTVFVISDLGKAALTKIRQQREQEHQDQKKKLKIEDLQEQLLTLSIQTAKSTLETNASIKDLNEATKKSLRAQKLLAALIVVFTLAQVIIAAAPYFKHQIAPAVQLKGKEGESGQLRRQPVISKEPKHLSGKDSL